MKKRFARIKTMAFMLVIVMSMFSLGGCIGPISCVSCLTMLSDETFDITSDAPQSESTISNEKYAYNTLDETHKKVYDELYKGIINMEPSIKVSTSDDKVLTDVTECIAADYGELFYVDGYSYVTSSGILSDPGFKVAPQYTMTKQDRDATQQRIDAVVNSWLSEIPTTSSDYEKSKWVYETLINRVDYVADAPDNQNIISVFLNGQTVCQGYSNAANYLFSKMGIQSIVVPGATDQGLHAWNCVKLDNEYYYMDITWGNANYGEYSDTNKVSYNMLNVTSEEMNRTHQIQAVFPMPDCYSINDNYFYQEGLYFDTFQKEKMGMILHNGYVQDRDVSIKCGNQETYNKMKEYFIDDGRFTEYCGGLHKLRYVAYPDDRIILYKFT